ncbi:MAG: adenylosuccinate lyase family protein [Desulfobulbales bacterium]|nr:adenylosuccinate lyase family protein [Desulfobulbales bacterium]
MECKSLSHIVDSRFYRSGYSTEESRRIFCDIRRMQRWLDVEIALATSQATLGMIPLSAADELAQTAQIALLDLDEVRTAIKNTGHSLIPLLAAWQKTTSPDASGYIHFGATTQDIQDTAQSLEIKEVLLIIERELRLVIRELIGLARRTRSLVIVGRSHGQHALPTTLGLKVAVWLDEMLRNGERLMECRKRVPVSQLFGGVGTMAAFKGQSLELLAEFSKRLRLTAPRTAWHASRDRMAELLSFMAILAGGLGKIANEICQLARNEICELEEPFHLGKIGSSTMPHKRNPELCEQVVVLSRLIKNQAASGFDGLINEHERDYRAVRLEWVSIPESSLMLCNALHLVKSILVNLIIHEDNIAANLERSACHISTEALMFGLGSKLGKHKAHQLLYDIAMKAYSANRELQDVLEEHPEITGQLSPDELAGLLKPENHTGMAARLTEMTVTAAEEWLSTTKPGNLSEILCPLADKNGECTIRMEGG